MLATDSITNAKQYYNFFSMLQRDVPDEDKLKVATIFSAAPRPDAPGLLSEEGFDTGQLDAANQQFLEEAIQDYNDMFNTSFDARGRFENYYKDLSKRIKDREVDLIIVVNMFLTGFDAKTFNTLFVDKQLRSHGLIQAFSRTNRILNTVKSFGNIVSFRDLEEETNDAIALFGNKDATGTVLLKPYREYLADYQEKCAELRREFPRASGPMDGGEKAKRDFVVLFGELLKLRSILSTFDEFDADDTMSAFELQNYQSTYVELYEEQNSNSDAISDDEDPASDVLEQLEFEIELVKQVEINIDYILMLVEQHRQADGDNEQELRQEVDRAVDASPSLRPKKDLIDQFIADVSASTNLQEEWLNYIRGKQITELKETIAEERLKDFETRRFISDAFQLGELQTDGTRISSLLPPVSRFAPPGNENHQVKRARVEKLLLKFFDRYAGLTSGVLGDDETAA